MSDVYAFQLGAFRCWVVSDGQRPLDDPNRSGFVNASDDEVLAELAAYRSATGDPADVASINRQCRPVRQPDAAVA